MSSSPAIVDKKRSDEFFRGERQHPENQVRWSIDVFRSALIVVPRMPPGLQCLLVSTFA